jgi:hypothetical protein
MYKIKRKSYIVLSKQLNNLKALELRLDILWNEDSWLSILKGIKFILC